MLECPASQQFCEAHPADDEFDLPATIAEQRQALAYAQWTLPDLFETCLGDLWWKPARDPTTDSFDRYGEFIRTGEEQMFGWPALRQLSMPAVCESEATGAGIQDVSAEAAAEWQLLLQYTYDGDKTIRVLEMGTLYFWIREADLRDKRFDKAVLIAQFV